ncbi:hypothetical protein DFS34DRAFT_380706 [Phlyctochytrium arcticum]|nr:hypothetical protein DFS34DRAFT_380706 [Phlyctochytrium arcticum]
MTATNSIPFLHQKLEAIRPLLSLQPPSSLNPSGGGGRPGSTSTTNPPLSSRPASYSSNTKTTEDLLISILLTLVANQQALLVCTKPDLVKELKKRVEQFLSTLFHFTVIQVTVDHTTSPSDLAASLFYKPATPVFNGGGSESSTVEMGHNNRRRARGLSQISRAESEEEREFLRSSKSSMHVRQQSTKSDNPPNLDYSDLSPLSLFVPSHRGVAAAAARTHSHNRNVASTGNGSRPVLFPFMMGGENAMGSSVSLAAMKVVPNVVVLEGLHLASPEVQATLVEVLSRRQVADKQTLYPCPAPFLIIGVMSTVHPRTPISSRLLDQFFLCHTTSGPLHRPNISHPTRNPLIRYQEIEHLMNIVSTTPIHAHVSFYLRDIILALRNHPLIRSGVSVPASRDLHLAARALGVLSGYTVITPDHIALMADKIIGHRLTLSHQSPYIPPDTRSRFKRLTGEDVVVDVVGSLPIPV